MTTATTTRLHFSPANQLLDEAKELCSEIHPLTHGFPRWFSNGSRLWIESSSRSLLLTVDFLAKTVIVPSWKVERDGCATESQMPEGWEALHRGSLFLPDGSAQDSEAFRAASAAWKCGQASC